jgi:hypothetical protein
VSVSTDSGVDAPNLEHIGVLFDPATGLAAGVLPLLRAALTAGRPVSALVEPDEADSLRRALPRDTGLTIAAPARVTETDSGLLEHLRGLGGEGQALVLAQYSVLRIGDIALRRGEERINQQLAELPVTLICACSTRERSPRLITARATHPYLVHQGVAHINSAYRVPDTPLEVDQGEHVLGLTFRGQPELHHVRGQVRAVAAAVGLAAARTDAWVGAVHEAAVIVSEAAAPDDVLPCELDMWAAPPTITAEVRGPAARGGPSEPGNGTVAAPSTDTPDPLVGVRLFCQEATELIDGDSRIVRLLSTLSHRSRMSEGAGTEGRDQYPDVP